MFKLHRKNFLASDYEVPINTTAVDGSEFTSKDIFLGFANKAALTFFVQGNHASVSQDVVFKFVTFDSKRNQWDTEIYKEVTITPNGDSVVQKTVLLDLGPERIKLYSVQNQETTSGYTIDVNVSIFLS